MPDDMSLAEAQYEEHLRKLHGVAKPTEPEVEPSNIVYNPETGELLAQATGQVVGQYEESPSETYSQRAMKSLRGLTKGGMAERMELGTILTPREQMRLNKQLGLRKYLNAPSIRRVRRTKGLPDLPPPSSLPQHEHKRKAQSAKQLERRRRLLLETLGLTPIERAEVEAV